MHSSGWGVPHDWILQNEKLWGTVSLRSLQIFVMTIQVGDSFPEATLFEAVEFAAACALPPKPVATREALAGKRVVVVGLIGAFTDTCALDHVPGYIEKCDQLKAKGIDEIWCVAVNDGFAMGAFGEALGATGKLRFLGDGSAELAKKLGLAIEIPGMGVRLARCSIFVDDGTVKTRQRRGSPEIGGQRRANHDRAVGVNAPANVNAPLGNLPLGHGSIVGMTVVRWVVASATLLLCCAFSKAARADRVDALRSADLVEVKHHVDLSMHRGYAKLVVRRTVFNGVRPDEATFWIDLP